jgi:hypothetical protein
VREFSFLLDAEGRAFCDEIIATMVGLFGISEQEALGRINNHWKNYALLGKDNIVYHELADFWAKTIYYEDGAYWWLDSAELKPRLYP